MNYPAQILKFMYEEQDSNITREIKTGAAICLENIVPLRLNIFFITRHSDANNTNILHIFSPQRHKR